MKKTRELIDKTIKSRKEQIQLDKQTVRHIAAGEFNALDIEELSSASKRLEINYEFLFQARQLESLSDEDLERKLIKHSESLIRKNFPDSDQAYHAIKDLVLLYYSSIR